MSRLINVDAMILDIRDVRCSRCRDAIDIGGMGCIWCQTQDTIAVIKDFSDDIIIRTKTVKYFDEDEKVWKVGEVIVDEQNR